MLGHGRPQSGKNRVAAKRRRTSPRASYRRGQRTAEREGDHGELSVVDIPFWHSPHHHETSMHHIMLSSPLEALFSI